MDKKGYEMISEVLGSDHFNVQPVPDGNEHIQEVRIFIKGPTDGAHFYAIKKLHEAGLMQQPTKDMDPSKPALQLGDILKCEVNFIDLNC